MAGLVLGRFIDNAILDAAVDKAADVVGTLYFAELFDDDDVAVLAVLLTGTLHRTLSEASPVAGAGAGAIFGGFIRRLCSGHILIDLVDSDLVQICQGGLHQCLANAFAKGSKALCSSFTDIRCCIFNAAK